MQYYICQPTYYKQDVHVSIFNLPMGGMSLSYYTTINHVVELVLCTGVEKEIGYVFVNSFRIIIIYLKKTCTTRSWFYFLTLLALSLLLKVKMQLYINDKVGKLLHWILLVVHYMLRSRNCLPKGGGGPRHTCIFGHFNKLCVNLGNLTFSDPSMHEIRLILIVFKNSLLLQSDYKYFSVSLHNCPLPYNIYINKNQILVSNRYLWINYHYKYHNRLTLIDQKLCFMISKHIQYIQYVIVNQFH